MPVDPHGDTEEPLDATLGWAPAETLDGRLGQDRGETLIELLVAMTISGIAIVVLIGGLGVAVRISDIHRKQAAAGAYVRSFAEAVQAAMAQSPTRYRECAGISEYETAYEIPVAKPYRREIERVRYWDANTSAFGTGCNVATDSGIQELSLRVSSNDGDAAETLRLIVRKPCRSTDGAC